MNLPQPFVERMKQQLGNEFEDFEKSLQENAPISIRLNPRKYNNSFETNEKVKWNENGRYLPERPVFTLDPLFHAGTYYVQEASSMFLNYAIAAQLDLNRPLRVMDLCGAPGGKSTLLASLLNDESLLVANEVIKSRVGVLKENLQKWGFANYIVANQDTEEMVELDGFFDIVVVDAPCSGEGLFRKDSNATSEWSLVNANLCVARQKRILQAAAMLVAEGGYLFYSTCTFNPEENDENVRWLEQITDLKMEKLAKLPANEIVETAYGYQFFPHKTKGEGFYLSILKQTYSDENYIRSKVKLPKLSKKQVELVEPYIKNADEFEFYLKPDNTIVALRKALLDDYGTVFRALTKRSSGIEIGTIKGTDFIPSHALALSEILNDSVPKVEVNKEEALTYLKKEEIEIAEKSKGWFIVAYHGFALGWAKVAGNRINNYLPKDWRIRMDLEG